MNDTWTRVTGNLVFSISFAAIGLFAAMLVALELGRRIGTRRLAALPPGTSWEIGTLDGAVFGLLGLLIAFTFSGAVSRFEARRHLVVEETNAIGTAYLRLDLLPVAAQPAMRAAFRRYLDPRHGGPPAELDPRQRLRGRHCHRRLRDARHRVPAARADPRRFVRPGADRAADQHAVTLRRFFCPAARSGKAKHGVASRISPLRDRSTLAPMVRTACCIPSRRRPLDRR